jgi:hypothetical protein
MLLNSGPESIDIGLSKVLPTAKPAVAPIAKLHVVHRSGLSTDRFTSF